MAEITPNTSSSLPAGGQPEPGWTHAVYWVLGCATGFIDAVRASGDRRRRQAAERWIQEWQQSVQALLAAQTNPGSADVDYAVSLDPLRRTLMGRTRAEIATLLGPPPATSAQPMPKAPGAYWYAETWYYPLDLRRHQGVAITFVNNLARSLDSFSGPR